MKTMFVFDSNYLKVDILKISDKLIAQDLNDFYNRHLYILFTL